MDGWADQHQPLIAGLIGFTGVIVTLFVNAWLARRQETSRLARQAVALRKSLLEELKLLLEVVKDRIDTIAKSEGTHPDGGILIPTDTTTAIFDASLAHIGLLDDHEISLVLRAYIPLKELPTRLRLIESRYHPDARKVEYGGVEINYAYIGSDAFSVVRELHSASLGEVEAAIGALEHRA